MGLTVTLISYVSHVRDTGLHSVRLRHRIGAMFALGFVYILSPLQMWPSIFFATASEEQSGTRGYKKDYNRFLLTLALFCGFGIVKQDWSLRIKRELSRVRNVLRGDSGMSWSRGQEGSCVIDGPWDLRSSLVHESDNKLCGAMRVRRRVLERFSLFPPSCSNVPLIFTIVTHPT